MARPIKMPSILKALQFSIMLKYSTDNHLPGQFSTKNSKIIMTSKQPSYYISLNLAAKIL